MILGVGLGSSPSCVRDTPNAHFVRTMADSEDFKEMEASYGSYGDGEELRVRKTVPTRYRRKYRKTLTSMSSEEGGEEGGEPEPPLCEGPERITYSVESDDDDSVDHDFDIASIAESEEDELTWRGRMQRSLHGHWFHIIIVVLVVIDAFIVLFELLLDVGAFNNIRCRGETSNEQFDFCHYSMPGSCSPRAGLILKSLNISESPNDIGAMGLCRCAIQGGNRVCLGENEPSDVNPSLILHIGSLFILSIFMLEVSLKWIAFRLKYFTHKFEVFDGIIVVVSFTLDIASLVEEAAFEAAALLIILRLWRVVRIVNGAVLSAKSQADTQLKQAKIQAQKIVHAFHKCQDRMDMFEFEVEILKKKLQEAGIPYSSEEVRLLLEAESDDTKL